MKPSIVHIPSDRYLGMLARLKGMMDASEYAVIPVRQVLQWLQSPDITVTDLDTTKLDDTAMRRMFSENWSELLYYNLDTGAHNRVSYLGHDIKQLDTDRANVESLRDTLANQSWYRDLYDLAAVVVMPISHWPGRAGAIEAASAEFDPESKAFAGTIVSRSKQTGDLIAPRIWLATNKYLWRAKGVNNAMVDFVQMVTKMPVAMATLQRVH